MYKVIITIENENVLSLTYETKNIGPLFDLILEEKTEIDVIRRPYERLRYAMKRGSTEMVKFLLCIHPKLKDNIFVGANLWEVGESGSIELTKFLINFGVKDITDIVYGASSVGHYPLVKFINETRPLTPVQKSNLIYYALKNDHKEQKNNIGRFRIAEYAIENGAILAGREYACILLSGSMNLIKLTDPKDVIPHVNTTTLFTEIWKKGYVDLLALLIEQNADPSAGNENALCWVCRTFPKPENLNWLLSVKADVTARNNEPICEAVDVDYLDIVKILVENKADVTAQYNYPIISATKKCCSLEMVKYLVENGADVMVQNNEPMRNAVINNNFDIVKFLYSKGASVNEGRLVYEASRYNFNKIVDFLVSKGGDINDIDEYHITSFRTRRAYRRWRLVHLKKWIRRVLIPLYFSPGFPGGSRAKKELELYLK